MAGGFGLAQGYVELSQKGFGPVSGAIDAVTGKLKTMAATPMNSLQGGLSGLKGHLAGMLSPMGLLTQALGALGAGLGVGAMVGKAAELETTRLEFDQLTRSVEGTDKLLKTLKKQFVGTGIDSSEWKAAAKHMLMQGVPLEEIPKKMKAMGNIAAATGEPISLMVGAMERAEVTGKVTSRTLMMMGDAVRDMLTQMYPGAEAVGGLMAAADNGTITLASLREAINNLGGDTGKFANIMAAKQASMAGQWESLKSNLGGLFTEIGEAIIEGFDLKTVSANLTAWVQDFRANYGEKIKNVFAGIGEAATWIWQHVQRGWEIVGPSVIKGFEALGNAFQALMDSGLIGWFVDLWMTIQSGMWEVLAVVFNFVADSINAIVDLVRNWDLYWRLAWEQAKLIFSNMWENVSTFGENVKRVFLWMVDVVIGVFMDIGNIIYYSISNTIGNIKALWTEFWAWLKSGGTKKWEPDTKNLLEGYKSSIKAVVPELAVANVQQTNEAIDKYSAELDKRHADRAAKIADKTKGKAGLPGGKAGGREQWINQPGGVAQQAVNATADKQKAEFVSLTQLAEKMQTEAAKNDIGKQQLAVQEKQADHLQQIAGCVQNGGLNLNLPNPEAQKWGNFQI